MNTRILVLIALASFQLYSSDDFPTTATKKQKRDHSEYASALTKIKSKPLNIFPKISLTDDEMKSKDKDKIRNNYLFGFHGCIVVMRECLSDEDRIISNQNIEYTIAQAVLNNDAITLKKAMKAVHNLRVKKALLPQIARCFPKDPISIQDFRNETGSSLLHLACSKDLKFKISNYQNFYDAQKINLLKYLIKNNINVDAQDQNGNTAMHHAMHYAYSNSVFIEILRETGLASMNVQNNNGETPILILAKQRGNYDANRKLLEALVFFGADINITDNQGQSVINILKSAYKDEYQHNLDPIIATCKNLGAQEE